MDVNKVLKELRKSKGISQEETARCIGVSLSSYQKYEREKNSIIPSLEVLIKLADFYGVTVDYLIGHTKKEEISPLEIFRQTVAQTTPDDINDDKFIEKYQDLPDYAKEIFIDTLIQLTEAAKKN